MLFLEIRLHDGTQFVVQMLTAKTITYLWDVEAFRMPT